MSIKISGQIMNTPSSYGEFVSLNEMQSTANQGGLIKIVRVDSLATNNNKTGTF